MNRIFLITSLLTLHILTPTASSMETPQKEEEQPINISPEENEPICFDKIVAPIVKRIAKEFHANVFDALKKIPLDSLDNFVNFLWPLLVEKTDSFERVNILNTFRLVPEDRWESISRIAAPILREFRRDSSGYHDNGYDYDHYIIIDKLKIFSPEKLMNFSNFISPMLTRIHNRYEYTLIMDLMEEIPPEKWGEFQEFATPLFYEIYNYGKYLFIFEDYTKKYVPDISLKTCGFLMDIFKEVQQENWVNFRNFICPLLNTNFERDKILHIIKGINQIPVEKWEGFAKSIAPLLLKKDYANSLELIETFLKIPQEMRNNFDQYILPLFIKVNQLGKMALLAEEILKIPEEKWEHFNKKATPLLVPLTPLSNREIEDYNYFTYPLKLEGFMRLPEDQWERFNKDADLCHLCDREAKLLFIDKFNKSSEKEWQKFIEFLKGRINKGWNFGSQSTAMIKLCSLSEDKWELFGNFIDGIVKDYDNIKTINSIPVEKWNSFIEHLFPIAREFNILLFYETLNQFNKIPDEIFAEACQYFATGFQNKQVHRGHLAHPPELLFYLMTNQTIKDVFVKQWHTELDSEDKTKAKDTSDFILSYNESFGLTDWDQIVQEALTVQILLNNDQDPLNPYNFYGTLRERRSEPVVVCPNSLAKETYNGITVSLNPEYLKTLNDRIVLFKELPAYDKDFFEKMKDALEQRLKNPDNKLPQTIESLNSIYQNSVLNFHIKHLLNTTGKDTDPVNPYLVKFVYCINYVQSLDNTPLIGQFSKQEEEFFYMLSSIVHCSHGQNGGIEDCYDRLPLEQRCKVLNLSPIHNCINQIMLQERNSMLSGTNPYFVALTEGLPNEDVNQAIHQAKFVRALIGLEVGCPLEFDRYTKSLNVLLVMKPKQTVLNLFYRYFIPRKIIYGVINGINKTEKESRTELLMSIGKEFIGKQWIEDAFDTIDNPHEKGKFKMDINEFGAIKLLLEMGILNLRD